MRYAIALVVMVLFAYSANGQPTYVDESVSTEVSSTTALSHTIPAGWSEGDLAIAFVYTGVRSVSAVPSGWTLIGSQTSGLLDVYVYQKQLVSGDINASHEWTLNANGSNVFIAFTRITGYDTSTPFNTSVGSYQASSTSQVSPAVTTTVDNCLIVRMSRTELPFSADSGDTGTEQYNTDPYAAFSSTKATAGDTGTATYTISSAREGPHFVVAVAPAAGGPAINPISSSIPGSSLDPIRTTIP